MFHMTAQCIKEPSLGTCELTSENRCLPCVLPGSGFFQVVCGSLGLLHEPQVALGQRTSCPPGQQKVVFTNAKGTL